jgi:hypothetical protein
VESKNVNPNGDNVGASNLYNVNFFFGNCEDWVQKWTNQHWMNQSFSCRYWSNPHKKKKGKKNWNFLIYL